MAKIKVMVLSGGPSPEHEVSLSTGRIVYDALRKNKKYLTEPMVISRDWKWKLGEGRRTKTFSTSGAIGKLREADIIFLATHGAYGEDGTIQGLLDFLGVKYTGSGVLASALAMDKIRTIELFSWHGLKVLENIFFRREDWKKESHEISRKVLRKIKLPCVVKPAEAGSSLGVSIVKKTSEIESAAAKALAVGRKIMIEKFIEGKEVTCGVLDEGGGKKPQALPPTEIIPRAAEFFDYEAKYQAGASEEITPARLPKRILGKIQQNALRAHEILGCRGLSRTDMIVSGRDVYVLETNTLPGMTATSLYPQEAKAAGISFSDLLDRLVKAGLRV